MKILYNKISLKVIWRSCKSSLRALWNFIMRSIGKETPPIIVGNYDVSGGRKLWKFNLLKCDIEQVAITGEEAVLDEDTLIVNKIRESTYDKNTLYTTAINKVNAIKKFKNMLIALDAKITAKQNK